MFIGNVAWHRGRFGTKSLVAGGIVACVIGALGAQAFGASGSWVALSSGDSAYWDVGSHWSSGSGIYPGAPSSTVNADTATLDTDAANGVQTTLNFQSSKWYIKNITFDSTNGPNVGSYYIAAKSLYGTSGGTWSMTSNVTTPQTIDGNVLLESNLTFSNDATDPTATFNFTGKITPDTGKAAKLHLAGANTGMNTISSVLSVPSGSLPVVKEGTGTWVLAASNTYSNETDVNGGTLLVNGATSANSLVVVADVGTLGGTGTVGGNVHLNGTLNPGVNGVGALTLGKVLTFETGATLDFDVAGDASDLVNFSTLGDNLVGSGLGKLVLSGDIDYSATYTIFHNVTTSGFTFSEIDGFDPSKGMPIFQQSGGDYVLSFQQIATAPEPASLMTLALGAGAMAARRRKRK